MADSSILSRRPIFKPFPARQKNDEDKQKNTSWCRCLEDDPFVRSCEERIPWSGQIRMYILLEVEGNRESRKRFFMESSDTKNFHFQVERKLQRIQNDTRDCKASSYHFQSRHRRLRFHWGECLNSIVRADTQNKGSDCWWCKFHHGRHLVYSLLQRRKTTKKMCS